MATELTIPQGSILHYLEERSANGESPPTYREICKHFGYKSTKAAADHVNALMKKGYVTRERGCARGLRLARENTGIPLLGRISAGMPREAFPVQEGRLPLDSETYGISDRRKAFALLVNGNSMIGRNIFDGDVVLLEQEVVPRNEDVVAALIDNECTLKTFIRQNGRVWLRAENPGYPNLIPALEMQIQGVARAVIRILRK